MTVTAVTLPFFNITTCVSCTTGADFFPAMNPGKAPAAEADKSTAKSDESPVIWRKLRTARVVSTDP
jgi:hypothetical protein